MELEVIENARVMGYTVFWSLNDTLLPLNLITEVADKHGLEKEFLREPTQKRAVLRACKEVAKAENGRFEDSYVRGIADTSEKYSVGILNETKDTVSDQVTANQTTTVKFDKTKKTVDVIGDKADEFKKQYQDYSDSLTDEDIRSYILKLVKYSAYGISLRPTGGFYFVPAHKLPVIIKIQGFLRELGIGDIYPIRTVEGDVEIKSVKEAYKTDLQSQLDLLLGNVSSVTKRVKCLHDKKDRVIELNEMFSAYQEVLSWETDAEDILTKLKNADTLISNKIKELS